MAIRSEVFVFDWKPDYPLATSVKRYWDPSSTRQHGYTMIFTHGISFNKEQWEPTLQHLFGLAKNADSGPIIREAWMIDCPNHGASALLNEQLLLRGGYELVFSWDEYIRTIYLFLTQNKKVEFKKHRLIGVGHSMGAVCLSLTQSYPYPPQFEALILCEPMFGPTDVPRNSPVFSRPDLAVNLSLKRRDTWPSRPAALSDFKTKRVFQSWDEDVLRAYIEHGLRALPTAAYPDHQGVTLACTKIQEAATYRDSFTARRAYEFLSTLYYRLPIHIIWGEYSDLLAQEVKDRASTRAGRKPASIRHISGAGHLLVQVAPARVAEAIYQAMSDRQNVSGRL